MTFPLDKKEKFPQIEHTQEYWKDIQEYQARLSSRNLPVIFSIQHLCLIAKVNIKDIVLLCESDRRAYYKRFKVKKKRGGFRVIHTPKPQIKYLQRWILYNILNNVKSHISCRGFEKGQSIKDNAFEHVEGKILLKLDLLRFYDSINERRIFGLFKSLGYHPNLAVYLAKICTIVPDRRFLESFKSSEQKLKDSIIRRGDGILPQGSPCSPKIANLIAMRLDNRLHGLSKKHEVNYTRYADDLTFSGAQETIYFLKRVVPKIVKDSGFHLNNSKTKLLRRGNPFFVTGLSVYGPEVRVPRKFKDDIEHHIYHCLKNGVHGHIKTLQSTKSNFREWLLGKIAFVKSIEPEIGEQYFREFNKIVWPI